MSWLTKISGETLTIITGDGSRFTPFWKNAKKTVSYNTASFNFPNVEGTLVQRSRTKSNNYSVEFYFQGNDHLDEAAAFEAASVDRRHWHIIHPFYGDIRVQPSGLEYDNSVQNITKITGTLLGTLAGVFPRGIIIPEDVVLEAKGTSDQVSSVAYANNVTPGPTDINVMNQSIDVLETSTETIIVEDSQIAEFKNRLSEARTAIINATAEPLQAMTLTQEVINYPFFVFQDVKVRLTTLTDQFLRITETLSNIITVPKNEKHYYESFAGTLISAMCSTVVTPHDGDNDYGSRDDVVSASDAVSLNYGLYLEALDSIQSETAQELDSYIPDSDNLTALNDLVNFTLGSLFEIALNARQERIVVLDQDNNLINLTHRFYGLVEDDSTIDEFIRNNDIGISEHLNIKKGRKLRYYV